MFTIEVDGKEYELPEFSHVSDETFIFKEGKYEGVTFTYKDIVVEEVEDEGAAEIGFIAIYEGLNSPEDEEELNALVGMVLVHILQEAVKHLKKEEEETPDD